MSHFYGWGSVTSRLQNHFDETVYFLPLSTQKFLVLIWLTSELWKAKLTVVPPGGFQHESPGFGIQSLKHYVSTQEIIMQKRHGINMREYRFSLACILPYKDRIVHILQCEQ